MSVLLSQWVWGLLVNLAELMTTQVHLKSSPTSKSLSRFCQCYYHVFFILFTHRASLLISSWPVLSTTVLLSAQNNVCCSFNLNTMNVLSVNHCVCTNVLCQPHTKDTRLLHWKAPHPGPAYNQHLNQNNHIFFLKLQGWNLKIHMSEN